MKRIQRKRTKGWRLPSNTVYVGRPTKWGNPYKLHNPPYLETVSEVLEAYKHDLLGVLVLHPNFLDPLKGKDLACWCPLDKPCHADVILATMRERRERELQELAKSFSKLNPRYMDYGIKFLHTAIKHQQGIDLSPAELQTYIKYLTGSTVNLALIEDHLKESSNQGGDPANSRKPY